MRACAVLPGAVAQGRNCGRRMAGTEGARGETGGGDGVGTISRAHASLVAILAFVLGALVTWMVPAMARDIKAWRDELRPRARR